MRSLLLILFVLSLTLLSCKGEGASSDSNAKGVADSSAIEPAITTSYGVVDVVGGGTIRGSIMVEGKSPSLPGFEITANEDICAGAADNNRLEVGGGGGIAGAVVRLVNVESGKSWPALTPEDLTVDQLGCRYVPHILAVPVGSEVLFTNSDPTAHNVRVEDTTEKILMNVAQPKQGDRNMFTVESAGPHSIGCDYHPWMNAYVFGVENPYYAVTKDDGTFELTNVPPGEYEIRVWLNGLKPIPKKDNRGSLIRYRFTEPYQITRKGTLDPAGTVEELFAIRVE
ncbi:MAG: hypothetical protein KDD67_06030 [Ignavibacteriae bacterium]|nr:hypothetical protein [Ignavibacteriota bacterium]MCB9215328.1 hypothetical protein [Ignavibacteria bacterium]